MASMSLVLLLRGREVRRVQRTFHSIDLGLPEQASVTSELVFW